MREKRKKVKRPVILNYSCTEGPVLALVFKGRYHSTVQQLQNGDCWWKVLVYETRQSSLTDYFIDYFIVWRGVYICSTYSFQVQRYFQIRQTHICKQTSEKRDKHRGCPWIDKTLTTRLWMFSHPFVYLYSCLCLTKFILRSDKVLQQILQCHQLVSNFKSISCIKLFVKMREISASHCTSEVA